MNHSQLRAFHTVAAEGSFTRAAAALRVSQPTLSGHVKALEEGYGVLLFHRSSREVVITEFGKVLFEVTQRYFASEIEAQTLLATAKGLLRGRLSLGADSPFVLVRLLAAFKRRYPRVEAKVRFGNSTEILRGLTSGEIDIGILPETRQDKRLNVVPFRFDRLIVFVDRGHPWSSRRSIKIHEIEDQNLIMRELGSKTRSIFEEAMRSRGISPKSVFEIGTREAVREAVAAGLGIGVVGESEFGHDNRIHALRVADAKLSVIECIAYRRDQEKTPIISAFLDVASEAAEIGRVDDT